MDRVREPKKHSQQDLELDTETGELDLTNSQVAQVQDELKRQAAATSAISRQCNDNTSLYQRLCVAIHDATPDECMKNGFDRDIALARMHDARVRFKAWATNIAALQGGQMKSSLDFRLKDAKEIRERILKILKDLQESMLSATLIVFGTEPNETWEVGAISDSEEEEEEEEEQPDEHGAEPAQTTSELDELFTAIETSNVSLMKLSMVIRKSPARDDYLKAATRYNFDSRYYIGHVKEKHGHAKRSSEWLLERLGKAMTRRRQYLKYREEHHNKLSKDWEAPVEIKPATKSNPTMTIALTKATTFVQTEPVYEPPESDGAGSFGSQTSYDATVVGESKESMLTVPSHPQMAFEDVPFVFGEPFQCPYCYTEQKVKNRAAWKKHVFRDLKPYVCTFKECDLKMFRSRNEWFAHEIQSHRREWTCQYCQHVPFTSSTKFSEHLKTTHHTTFSGSELEAVILQSEEPIDRVPASACSLCDDWELKLLDPKHDAGRAFLNEGKIVEPYGTLKQFRRHLGRHMEQLALFVLPRTDGDEMEDESLDDNEVRSEVTDQSEMELEIKADPPTVPEREPLQDWTVIDDPPLDQVPPDAKPPSYVRCVRRKTDRRVTEFSKDLVLKTILRDLVGEFIEHGTHFEVQSRFSYEQISEIIFASKARLDSNIYSCICGKTDPSGNLILCDACGTWQDITCYYPTSFREAVQAEFYHSCVDCDKDALKNAKKQEEFMAELLNVEENFHNEIVPPCNSFLETSFSAEDESRKASLQSVLEQLILERLPALQARVINGCIPNRDMVLKRISDFHEVATDLYSKILEAAPKRVDEEHLVEPSPDKKVDLSLGGPVTLTSLEEDGVRRRLFESSKATKDATTEQQRSTNEYSISHDEAPFADIPPQPERNVEDVDSVHTIQDKETPTVPEPSGNNDPTQAALNHGNNSNNPIDFNQPAISISLSPSEEKSHTSESESDLYHSAMEALRKRELQREQEREIDEVYGGMSKRTLEASEDEPTPEQKPVISTADPTLSLVEIQRQGREAERAKEREMDEIYANRLKQSSNANQPNTPSPSGHWSSLKKEIVEEIDDDVLFIKNKGITYPLNFPPYSIGDGKLLVQDVRVRAAAVMDLPDPTGSNLKLLYKGAQLKEAFKPCRDYDLRHKSEILCVVSPGKDGDKLSSPSKRNPPPPSIDNELQDRNNLGTTSEEDPSQFSAIHELGAISTHLHTKFLPLCVQFTSAPPVDPKKKDLEYKRLCEGIMNEVIFKLDSVDAQGIPEIRQKRKELLRETQDLLRGLDAKMAE